MITQQSWQDRFDSVFKLANRIRNCMLFCARNALKAGNNATIPSAPPESMWTFCPDCLSPVHWLGCPLPSTCSWQPEDSCQALSITLWDSLILLCAVEAGSFSFLCYIVIYEYTTVHLSCLLLTGTGLLPLWAIKHSAAMNILMYFFSEHVHKFLLCIYLEVWLLGRCRFGFSRC